MVLDRSDCINVMVQRSMNLWIKQRIRTTNTDYSGKVCRLWCCDLYIPWNFNGHKLQHFRSVSQCGPSDLFNLKLWEQKWQKQSTTVEGTGNHHKYHKLFVNEHDSNKWSNCPQGCKSISDNFKKQYIYKNKESVHLCALSWFNAQMLIEWIIPFSFWGYVWIFYQPPHVIPLEVNFEAAPCAGNSRELRLQAMRGHARLAWPGENIVEIGTINAMQVQVVELRVVAWYKTIRQ